jgi:hypothetical protein
VSVAVGVPAAQTVVAAPTTRRTPLLLLTTSGFPLAGLGFVTAYRNPGQAHEIYWLAVALTLATTAVTYALAVNKRRAGAVLAVMVAVVLSLPKFLRAPRFFNFFDEQAHLYAVDAMLHGARLFADNPLNRVVSDYPGLHAVTSALAAVTGGSVFATGNLVMLAIRAAGCLAVFLLAERLARAAWAPMPTAMALFAVVVFAANPAFAFFDAQFAYESLASPLVAVVLLLAVRLDDAGPRWGAAGIAAVLTALVVLTHHGSSYVLAGLLAAIVLARLVASRRPPLPLVVLAGAAVAMTAGWLLAAAGYTMTYVGPYVSSNLASVPEFLSGSGSGPRRLFGGFLPVPAYERVASFAAVVILFALFCWGATAIRRAARRADAWLLVGLGTVYFLSLPLVALRGDQVVKRFWEFAFIGLAPVCAVAFTRLVRGRISARVLRGRVAARVLAAALVVVVFVGSGVARSGEHIRFPGPYLPSADPRSMTADVVDAAHWLRAAHGPHHRVAGDRTLALTLGSHGMQTPVTYEEDGFAVWTVITPKEVTPAVLAEIRRAGLEWIAVDLRSAGHFPLTGFYFNDAEPGAYVDTSLTTRALTKFDSGPFRRAYDNGHVVLYRVAP